MGDDSAARSRRIVGALLLFQLIASWVWLGHDATPLGYEVPEHWLTVREAADDLRAQGDPLTWPWRNRRQGHRPAAVHLLVAPLIAIAPHDEGMVRVATWCLGALTLTLLTLGSWRLGEALARGAGPVSAMLVLVLPASWGFSRKLGVDLPAAALFTLIAASMIADPPWERRRGVLRLGLLCGLACLVRAQLALWIGALAIVSAFGDQPRGTAVTRLLLFALAAALGSAPFWAGSPEEMRLLLADIDWSARGPHTQADGWALDYYPRGIARWIGWPIGLMTALGCLLWLRAGDHGYRPGARTLALGLLLGLLPWVFYRVRWVRYALPLMPPLIALGAAGLMRLGEHGRRALLSLALCAALLAEIAASTGLTMPPPLRAEPAVELCHAPTQIDWPGTLRPLARALQGTHVVVGITGPDEWQPDHYTILEWALRTHLPPEARIYRDSAARDPQDREDYRAARPRMTLIVRVFHGANNPPPVPDGWHRRRATALLDFDSDVAWRMQAEELVR